MKQEIYTEELSVSKTHVICPVPLHAIVQCTVPLLHPGYVHPVYPLLLLLSLTLPAPRHVGHTYLPRPSQLVHRLTSRYVSNSFLPFQKSHSGRIS